MFTELLDTYLHQKISVLYSPFKYEVSKLSYEEINHKLNGKYLVVPVD